VVDNDSSVTCPSHGGDPIPCAQDLGWVRGGRSTVLVTAIGEESFIDRNGNGIMDEDEQDLFDNIPEAFIDKNEDLVYTPALPECQAAPNGSLRCISGQEDLFTDFNANNAYDLNDDPAVYNGLLCPVAGDGIWCSRQLVNVRASNVVILGDSPNWYPLLLDGGLRIYPGGYISGNSSVTLLIADTYNNPPPGGATISVSADGDCKILEPTSTEALNVFAPGAFEWGFSVSYEPGEEPQASTVSVTLETPTITITWPYNCGP